MNLHCPDCGSAVLAEDIDLSTTAAKCRACNGVFSFTPSLAQEKIRAANRKQSPEAIAARPTWMRVDDWGGTFRISWRWFGLHYLGLLIFCIAWNSFLIFWYSMATKGNTPWLLVILPIGHVALGIAMAYSVLTGFINSTSVELSGNSLKVQHGPLPWRGNVQLTASQIAQLFCEQTTRRNRNGPDTVRYDLSAVLADGSKIKLVRACNSPADVKFLENVFENRLGLAPREVAGEYRG